MSTKDNLLQSGIQHLSGLLDGYLDSFKDPELSKALWEAQGVSLPDGENPPPVPDETIRNIEAYRKAVDPDLEAFYNALQDVRRIIDSVRAVAEAHHADGGWGTADELSRQMLNELTLNYIRFRFPTMFHIMRALRFAEDKLDDSQTNSLFWNRVGAFFKDVGGYFEDTFNSLQTENDARELANFFFLAPAAALGKLLGKKGFIGQFRWEPDPDSATPRSDSLSDRTLSVLLPRKDLIGGSPANGKPSSSDLDIALFATSTFVPREHGGPGLLLSIGGDSELALPIDLPLDNESDTDGDGTPNPEPDTKFILRVKHSAPATGSIFIPFDGDTSFPVLADALQGLELTASIAPEGTFRNSILGSSKGTRLELGKPSLSLMFRKLPDKDDFAFDVKFATEKSALIIVPPKGDGFLGNVLPAGDLRIQMDIGVGVKKAPGGDWDAYLVGGDSLEVTLPGGKKLGPVELKELTSKLNPQPGSNSGGSAQGLRALAATSETGGVEFEQTAALSVRLGPVTATLDRIGFRITVKEATNGNLGLYDVNLGFRHPDGVGIAVDAGTVKGGGYLFYDEAKAQYAGIMRLQFQKIALNAVGLLTTRMPDGSRGFSLLLMLAVEDFPPINLGMGFRLTGIGGLIGFNRSVAVDLLKNGLKAKTLDAVLFPEDPVRHAVSIVNGLERVFPPRRDQHVIGPVAEITWGTGGLLTAQVGLIMEFPNPVRLALLGQISARFPSPQRALIRLNMDLFGAIDFDKGEALVLATLFDSKILHWNVSGDAAFYARWEQNPTFILSAGGFHPNYPAPSELPPLERLSMVLSEGDRLRLRMTWYLALTSNSLQHGSHVELFVSAAGFSVNGHLGYDTLVQFDPFAFTISFTAGVGLKWHGHTLAAIQLDGNLAGPSPWHVQGKASFKIWRFSKSVSFDKTIGEAEALPPMPVVDPLPALVQALKDPGNWQSILPAQQEMVTLRNVQTPGVVHVHPLGGVSVRQQVLPLNVPITKFGNSRVGRQQSYGIESVDFNNDPSQTPDDLMEHFAPGQFQELSKAERLSRPSFEEMPAGVRVATDSITFGSGAHMRRTSLSYETAVLVDAGTVRLPGVYTPAAGRVLEQANFGSAARSPLRRQTRGRSATGTVQQTAAENLPMGVGTR